MQQELRFWDLEIKLSNVYFKIYRKKANEPGELLRNFRWNFYSDFSHGPELIIICNDDVGETFFLNIYYIGKYTLKWF